MTTPGAVSPLLRAVIFFLMVNQLLGEDFASNSSRNKDYSVASPPEYSPSINEASQSQFDASLEMEPVFLEAVGFECPGQCPPCPGCPVCPSCPGSPPCPNPPSCPRVIPPGYRHYANLGYYKMHYEEANWYTAKETCEREGGYLVVLNSKEEANLPGKLLRQKTGKHNFVFIGLHDLLYWQGKSKFVTVLGDELSTTGYTAWAPNEPNNPGKELCASVHIASSGLNDELCSNKYPFLCELFD